MAMLPKRAGRRSYHTLVQLAISRGFTSIQFQAERLAAHEDADQMFLCKEKQFAAVTKLGRWEALTDEGGPNASGHASLIGTIQLG